MSVDHHKPPLAMGQPGVLPSEINIVTLNCWGLKLNISKQRQARLAEIGAQLANTHPPPNIVCLQEIWAHDDYLAVRRQLRTLLPHGKFYYAGSFGAGLAILSRWPIEQSTFTPYTLNGRPTAFWRGDWYVGKGIAHARIRMSSEPHPPHPPRHQQQHHPPTHSDNDNDAIILEVFNTHTHAPYASDKGDSYRVHRMSQAWQLAKLLSGAAERGHLVIAAGDFNMTPLSPEHRILTTHAPVRDVWRVLHPDSSLGSADDPRELARRRLDGGGDGVTTATLSPPTAETNLLLNGATSNSILNTWRWSKADQKKLGPSQPLYEPALDTPDPQAKRLDYIFTSVAPRLISTSNVEENDGGGFCNRGSKDVAEQGENEATIGGWVVRDARVGMTRRHPVLGCSLSDHFSVEATLVFHTTTTRQSHVQQQNHLDYLLRHRQRHHNHNNDDEDDAAAGTTITDGTLAAPSISQWPLPPGHHHLSMRSSSGAYNRRSEAKHSDNNDNDGENRNNTTHFDTNDDDANSEDLRSPAAGAFLSLQSPTPSTSRQSQGQEDDDDDDDNIRNRHNTRSATTRVQRHRPSQQPLDFDTQLLSSITMPTATTIPHSESDLKDHLPDNTHFTAQEYYSLLTEVQGYVAREAQQTRWRTWHFAFWVVVTIACYVVAWFIPNQQDQHGLSSVQNHAINFVLLLLSSLGLVAGVLDGLMALLFFRGSEKRALKEFSWELRNTRALACGETLSSIEEDVGGTKEF